MNACKCWVAVAVTTGALPNQPVPSARRPSQPAVMQASALRSLGNAAVLERAQAAFRPPAGAPDSRCPPAPLAATLHALLLTQLPWCLQAKQSWWLAAARAARFAWWVPPPLPAARLPREPCSTLCLAIVSRPVVWAAAPPGTAQCPATGASTTADALSLLLLLLLPPLPAGAPPPGGQGCQAD